MIVVESNFLGGLYLMMPKDTKTINAFIKYFLNYVTYLEKEMSDDTFNFNEIRILFELLEKEKMYAKDIENQLDLDKGYTSRILKKFMDENIIQKDQSDDDKRLFYLSFTDAGKKTAETILAKYEAIINTDLEKLTAKEQKSFISAIETIQKIHDKKFVWKKTEEPTDLSE
ncbi:hypothetical protein CBF35_02365 [Vagococcus salmoninarum]|uniref:HTH marR-type domain-containing protein n=2 Tax=Vagococcus salmoninarum TaxID=2739 RepID=A0A429ZUZ7_9ENTE|nr:hypothetical protein CBF35_02365 [Vagococcus salmoninarum]